MPYVWTKSVSSTPLNCNCECWCKVSSVEEVSQASLCCDWENAPSPPSVCPGVITLSLHSDHIHWGMSSASVQSGSNSHASYRGHHLQPNILFGQMVAIHEKQPWSGPGMVCGDGMISHGMVSLRMMMVAQYQFIRAQSGSTHVSTLTHVTSQPPPPLLKIEIYISFQLINSNQKNSFRPHFPVSGHPVAAQ